MSGNQQRAAKVLRRAVMQRNSEALAAEITVALDAAEQRGRDEVAARLRELAMLLELTADGHREHQRERQHRDGIAIGYTASADRLRALAAEVES